MLDTIQGIVVEGAQAFALGALGAIAYAFARGHLTRGRRRELRVSDLEIDTERGVVTWPPNLHTQADAVKIERLLELGRRLERGRP